MQLLGFSKLTINIPYCIQIVSASNFHSPCIGNRKNQFSSLILYMNEHWTYLRWGCFCSFLLSHFNLTFQYNIKIWWSEFENQFFVLSLKIFSIQRMVHLFYQSSTPFYSNLIMVFSCFVFLSHKSFCWLKFSNNIIEIILYSSQ